MTVAVLLSQRSARGDMASRENRRAGFRDVSYFKEDYTVPIMTLHGACKDVTRRLS